MSDLNEIRKEIDNTDRQLIELLEKRINLSKEVAFDKLKTGKKIYDKEREKQKIASVESYVKDETNVSDIEKLYEQIMSGSRKIQYRILEQNGNSMLFPYETTDTVDKPNLKVIYQGIPGAYSHIALQTAFSNDVQEYNVPTWKEAIEAVLKKTVDYAVLPIENSTAGSVTEVYDLLNEFPVYIVKEVYVKIEHNLLVLPGTKLEDIKTVISHPQALMQSNKFLEEHADWERKSAPNTAVAAKTVKSLKDKSVAAIASSETAEIYGLETLAKCINDEPDNTTRFVVVSNKRCFLKDAKKVSVIFETLNENGALYNLLSPVNYNDISMTKIESRPIRGVNWDFRFFLDIEGNLSDPAVRDMLRGMYEESTSFRLLGNY